MKYPPALLSALALVLILSGCAATERKLPTYPRPDGLTRIQFLPKATIGSLIRADFAGYLVEVQAEDGTEIYSDTWALSPRADRQTWVDVPAGSYKIGAHCTRRGAEVLDYPAVWMLFKEIAVSANQTVTLACEEYVVARRASQGLGDRILDKKRYSVRLVLTP